MMRKVIEIEEWEFPYSIIETQSECIIVDIPETYLTGYDETGEPIHTEVDESTIGESATWADVNNLFLFDLKIGSKFYSWKRKEGFIHIGLKDNKIGIVKYKPFYANGKELGKVKKTIIPEMLGNPALELVDGRLSINGQSYGDVEFFDMSMRCISKLSNILKIKDGVEYPINFMEREDVEVIA